MHLMHVKPLFPTAKGSIGNATAPVASRQAIEKALPRPTHVETKTLVDATRLRDALEDRKTAITGETLDFETVSTSDLDGTSVSPQAILDVIEQPDVYYHVWVAVKRVVSEKLCPSINLWEAVMNQFLVEIGNGLMDRVPGPHMTFIDPRLTRPSDIIKSAKDLVDRFEQSGVKRTMVVVSIPATTGGMLAAQKLEAVHSIQTNLILISEFMHAVAAAEAGAATVTFSVGSALEWHEIKRKAEYRLLEPHPGIEAIQAATAYFRLHNIKTKLIGSGFRELAEIAAVGGGLDVISLSKELIELLMHSKLPLSPSPTGSSMALQRARLAQHPTTLLQSKLGFEETISAEMRSAVTCTLHGGLGKMKVQMEALEEVINKELKYQVMLETVGMKKAYRYWNKGRPKQGPSEGSNHTPQDGEVKGKANPSVAGSYPTKEPSLFEDVELL